MVLLKMLSGLTMLCRRPQKTISIGIIGTLPCAIMPRTPASKHHARIVGFGRLVMLTI